MNKRLRQRYRAAEQRAKASEAEVQRVSESRLAELMKLSPLRRFQQIDDPLLTPDDRLKLRNSIEAKLDELSSRPSIKVPRRWSFRGMRAALRYAPTILIMTAITFPTAALAYKAWKNTDEVVSLSLPLDLLWTLPSGTKERKVMPAGSNLAIKRVTETSAIARRWIEGVGYATSEIRIR